MFLPFSSPRRTNTSMECSVECFKHTYTHALVHVSTGDMHRMITVEGTRFVMVLSFTAGTAPRSTAGPGALGSKPGARGAGFSTGVLLPTGLLPLPANCPSWVSPTAAAIGWPRAAEAVLSLPGDSQPCRPLGTDIPWGCSGAGTVMQAKPYWSACSVVCWGFRGAQAAAGVWIQAHLQALQAEMLQLPEEPWALSTQCGSKAEQGPLSAQSTALLPLPNGQHSTAGEFLRLFTPVGYFCNQLYFMTVNTNCCGRAGRSWWHLQER